MTPAAHAKAVVKAKAEAADEDDDDEDDDEVRAAPAQLLLHESLMPAGLLSYKRWTWWVRNARGTLVK